MDTREDSEDAAHDAVVQAICAAERFRSDAQVTTWMHRIAVNAALMARRKTKRAGKHIATLATASEAGLPGPWNGQNPAADLMVSARAERLRLRAAVERLPSGYRTVVERCVFNEESPEEAARVLHLTAAAVRTRMGRARKQIEEILTSSPVAA
jgi:RNA polymerase sigma-70 factor (ECF subfamily)